MEDTAEERINGEDKCAVSEEAVLMLTGIRRDVDRVEVERHAAAALGVDRDCITLIEDDPAWMMIVYGGDGSSVARQINALVQSGGADAWLTGQAVCAVAEEEEEVLIDEDEALRLWREEKADRTSHLDAVPDPDGQLVMPTHDAAEAPSAAGWVSPTHAQLQRDPTLLDFDNVSRVHVSEIHTVAWSEPVVITGCGAAEHAVDDAGDNRLARSRLMERFGEAEVRTGNRQTLIDNGFANSKPMRLRDALGGGGGAAGEMLTPECGRMVFSPVKELPEAFRDHLHTLTEAFPCEHAAQGKARVSKHFTLCLAHEGFGIGFHRHNAAMFYLVVGQKKWYMGPQSTEENTPTHPGFYTTKSTHKCIQRQGEILYVPDEWYHEIFNLSEYTAGVQALPSF